MAPELNETKMMSWFHLGHEFCKLFSDPDIIHCIPFSLPTSRQTKIQPSRLPKDIPKISVVIVITFASINSTASIGYHAIPIAHWQSKLWNITSKPLNLIYTNCLRIQYVTNRDHISNFQLDSIDLRHGNVIHNQQDTKQIISDYTEANN